MAEYQSFHCTALGYSHIKKGTVCQDSSGSCDGEGLHMAVVSDGHGQKSSFRSDVGSRTAVETAMELLQSLAEYLTGQEELIFQEGERSALLRRLADRVVSTWHSRIRQHLQENPITDEEYEIAGDMAEHYRAGRYLPQIYGATLIAAMATEKYLLVMHQGDGRCVVIKENGKAVEPVRWDSRCVGNVCTSLCQSDAAESCRFYVADLRKEEERFAACYVASDGIEDCFSSISGAYAFFSDLTARFARDGGKVEQYLMEMLPLMSRNGSADDMSVAAVVSPSAAARLGDRLKLVSHFYTNRTALHNAREKMRSMERKMEHLRSQHEKAARELEKCKWNANQRGQETTGDIIHAEGVLRKTCEEYNAYVERFNSFRAQAAEARENSIRILMVMRLLECESLLDVDEAEISYIRQKIQGKKVLARNVVRLPLDREELQQGEDDI